MFYVWWVLRFSFLDSEHGRHEEMLLNLYSHALHLLRFGLLDHIRYVLWDEVSSDIPRPANPYDDFLVV